MAFRPEPGHVIRYAYLWDAEARAGRAEGRKDRPCAVILAVDEADANRVAVLPITHSPPAESDAAVEIPAATKRRLGLDDDRSWVVLSEANVFQWPGPDLRPLPGQGLETALIGVLPAGLFRKVRDGFVTRWRARRSRMVRRTP